MDAVEMNWIFPVSPKIVKNLLTTHQPGNTSLNLATTPIIILQDISKNLLQVPNNDVIVKNVKLNLPIRNIQQPCSNLRNVRNVQTPNKLATNRSNSEELEDDCRQMEASPSTKCIQPSVTKALSSAKKATLEKVIESLPEETDLTPIKKSTEPLSKNKGKKGSLKNCQDTVKEMHFKCNICDLEFKKRYLYQRHMHEHSQEKPHHCPKCSASFNVPTNFTLHMATHNIGEPKCPMCNKRFARIASLKAHMVMHEKDENLYCPECDGVFETKAQLDAHMKLHDTDKWSIDDFRKCKLCRAKFTHPALYRQHLRDHYKVQTKIEKLTKRGVVKQRIINSCKICKKSFDKPSQLARHLRVHTGEKPYKCNLCNRGFTQKGSLKIHMWQHDGNRPHSCSFCHAKFSQKGNLNSHILRTHKVHEGSPVYRCSHCPCIFKSLGSLNGHINRLHSAGIHAVKEEEEEEEEEKKAKDQGATEDREQENEDNEIEATDIDNVMNQLADLESCVQNTSLARRPGEDDIVCENGKEKEKVSGGAEMDKNLQEGFVVTDDNEQTAIVTVLDKASSEVEGKYVKIKQRYVNNFRVYECSYCDKKFKKPSDLMRHLRIHTREKPFKCNVCNRGFTLKSTLLAHGRVHQTEEKFRCKICRTTWRSKSQLSDHEKMHTKDHACEICDKQFSSFKQLKIHAQVHEIRMHKKNVSEEVQDLAGKVQLKDPLELKLSSNGLLLAEPKCRNDIINGRGRPHKCPTCPAAFMKLSHLKQHHRKHTGERPFECKSCNRKFTSTSALNTHTRIHEFSKPFKCPVCAVTFTTRSSMKRHMVTHTNKRPYMCPYCNKTFKTTVNCRKHIKVHKLEIAEQEVEKQRRKTEPTPSVHTQYNNTMTFLPFQNKSEQNLRLLLRSTIKEEEQPFVSILQTPQNVISVEQNQPIVANPNIGTTQKILANETGTLTLANFSNDQTFTPDNIKVLADSLNQQLLTVDMNLGLNNNAKKIENQSPLESQNQPILSIIYNDGKPYESPINTSVNTTTFIPQLNNFDLNQMTLQTLKNEIEMRITPSISTNMTNILPKSIQRNQNMNVQLVNNDFEFNNLQLNQITVSSDQTVNVPLTNVKKYNQHQENQILIEDGDLQCHMCKKGKFTAESLKEHLKTHQGSREFECTYCLSKFCSSGGLSRHVKIHETPETHKCYDCKQEFPTSRQLTVHIKEHVRQEMEMKKAIGPNETIDVGLKDVTAEKKNNQCTYCSKIFRKPSDLVRHVRTHTGERPYKCTHCEKSFAVKCTLDSHVKVHDGVKQFHCYVCNNVFATKGSLKVHIRLHTGDKPFQCNMCDAKFRTSGHRKVHMVSHTRESGVSTRKLPKRKKNTPKPVEVTEVANKDFTAQMMLPTELVPNQNQVDNEVIVNDQSQLDRQIIINNQNQVDNHIIVDNQNQVDNQTIDENLDTITLNSVTDQITFNADGAVLNDSTGILNLNDSNQLVANLQYLLTNGLVSVRVDDPAINAQLPASAVEITAGDFEDINTNDALKQTTDSHIVFSTETFNPESGITNVNNFELDNCMVFQIQDTIVPPTTKEKVKASKQSKTSNNTTRRECDICGKTFAKPCQVERHKRIHTGERPFKCDICDKSFAQKSTLNMHKKHHTGDRPYPCSQCQRSFTQSGNLHTHLKRVHKLNAADVKRMTKQLNANYDPKLVDDVRALDFVDFSFADLLK